MENNEQKKKNKPSVDYRNGELGRDTKWPLIGVELGKELLNYRIILMNRQTKWFKMETKWKPNVVFTLSVCMYVALTYNLGMYRKQNHRERCSLRIFVCVEIWWFTGTKLIDIVFVRRISIRVWILVVFDE